MNIIATIGPRNCTPSAIDEIVEGGCNIIRINLSHGNYDDIKNILLYIRQNYKSIKILMDLQGNKIRVSKSIKDTFKIMKGDKVCFCSEEDYNTILSKRENGKVIPLNIGREFILNNKYKKVYMKDGTMEFDVLENTKDSIKTVTKIGGVVRGEKGCNLPGIDRLGWRLTKKDKDDISFALNNGVDILCYSYCSYDSQCKEFKERVFKSIKQLGKVPKLWGKIETKEGIENIKSIAKELDGIVIARGDLVPEAGLFNIPIIQEKIIYSLKGIDKEIIAATNVLSSMKYSSKPTINELSDIYSLLKGGVTGFMLTGETTIGKNNKQIVNTLNKTIKYYEGIISKGKVKK